MTDHATPRFIGIHAAEFVVVRLGVSIPGVHVYITQCRLSMQRSRTVGQDLNKIIGKLRFVIVNLLWLNSFIISRTFFYVGF